MSDIKEGEEEAELIEFIMSKTTYSEEEAREKLTLYEGNHIKVINKFYSEPKKAKPSLNQQIYRQMRLKLDESMREYEERKEAKEAQQAEST